MKSYTVFLHQGKVHPCCNKYQDFIFLWLNNIPLCVCVCVCVCVYHIFFIHSSVDGQLSFHIMAIMLLWKLGWMYLFELVLSYYCINNWKWGNWIIWQFCGFFWVISIWFSTVTALIYNPTNSSQEFPFLHILISTYSSYLFDSRHSNRDEVLSHYGFDFNFPD